MAEFRLPGASDRTVVIGGTGTGKTVFGAWLLSKQRFDKRPWVCIDFKNEELWDKVGDPPMRPLKLGSLPGKRGLYRMHVLPGQEDELEEWLWKVWAKGNIGIFCDEVTLLPQKKAFKSILRQGRSLLIPVIACTQRPVEVDREVFSESQFKAIFRVDDIRDLKTIQGFTFNAQVDNNLPEHWCHWVDAPRRTNFTLKPCPPPDMVAQELRDKAPYSWWLG